MVSYASVCWVHELGLAKIREGLLKLDRLALLAISQVAPSSPTRGLSVIYDLLPLHIHLKHLGLMTYLRLAKLMPLTWDGN